MWVTSPLNCRVPCRHFLEEFPSNWKLNVLIKLVTVVFVLCFFFLFFFFSSLQLFVALLSICYMGIVSFTGQICLLDFSLHLLIATCSLFPLFTAALFSYFPLFPAFSLGRGRTGENYYLVLTFKTWNAVGDFTTICSPVENSWHKLSVDVVVI